MDVIKVFTEEPLALEALSPDDDPDARRREVPPESLEAFLARSADPYARAYLAGTALATPRRVGLTALADAQAWVQPLLAWAAGRDWTVLDSPASRGLLAAEVAGVLRQPGGARALGVGPVPPGALAAAVGGQRRDRVPALREILDAGAAVLFPETAHDGVDWSLFAPAPLHVPLVNAFRQRPGTARCLVAPFRRARGEHTFYLEQWALDNLPDWVEEV